MQCFGINHMKTEKNISHFKQWARNWQKQLQGPKLIFDAQ